MRTRFEDMKYGVHIVLLLALASSLAYGLPPPRQPNPPRNTADTEDGTHGRRGGRGVGRNTQPSQGSAGDGNLPQVAMGAGVIDAGPQPASEVAVEIAGDTPLVQTVVGDTTPLIVGDVALTDANHRIQKWDVFPIYYQISSTFSADHKKRILEAVARIEQTTCVSFKKAYLWERLRDNKFIYVQNTDSGCWSNLGVSPTLNQTLNLGPSCFLGPNGVIIQQFLRALGLTYTHQGYNRDQYITVNENNIMPGHEGSYVKSSTKNMESLGIAYDHSSLMHYGPRDFAKNPEVDIMVSRDGNKQRNMGNQNDLTFFDAMTVNKAYCPDACVGVPTHCMRGGYPDPDNCGECLCIEGWTGRHCDVLKPSSSYSVCPEAGYVTVNSKKWTCLTVGNYTSGTECNWQLKGKGRRSTVDFKFGGSVFDVACSSDKAECRHYVEVRYGEQELRGPRFCCDTLPVFAGGASSLRSTTNEMTIMFRSVEERSAPSGGFTMCYKKT